MLIAYVVMCLIYGTTFLTIKVGLSAGFPPFMFAGLRFGTAGLLILLYLYLRRRPVPQNKRDLLDLAQLGVCTTFITFAALYWGEQHISSGLAALLSAAGPMMVLVFNLLAERKKPTGLQVAGLLLGAFGLYLVVLPNLQFGVTRHWFLASAGILLSEIAFAWGAILSGRLLSRGLAPLSVNGFQMLFGGMGLLGLSLLSEPLRFDFAAPLAAWGSLLYLTVFGSMVAFGIYYWLVGKTNPLFPTTWVYVSPVIAMFVGALFLDEPLRPAGIAGAALIIAGVVLTNLQDLRKMMRKAASAES